MAENIKTILGKGWSFPPTFDRHNKKVEMVSNEDDIYQSLQILLSTGLGERVMQPDYGSELSQLLFEPIDVTFETYIKDRIKDAILYHEPRITTNLIEIERNEMEGLINISIDFTIRTTNSRSNIVFPFYLNEATNII